MAREKVWPPRVYPHKPSGRERVRVGGKDVWLGPIGSAEAKVAYAELVAQMEKERRGGAGRAAPGKRCLTVAGLVREHAAYAKQRYSAEGREASQFRWACEPLLALYADAPVADFGGAELGWVREEMVRLGWSLGVINRRVTRLRTLWRWAEGKGLAPEGRWATLSALAPLDPTDARVKKAAPRKATDWPTLAKVCRQLQPVPRAMLLVGWYTGCRPAEARNMKAGEVDRSGDVWLWRPAAHKNAWRGQERVIAVGPRCQALLGRWLKGKAPGEHVFLTAWGRPYSDNTYAQAVKRAALRAGVEGVTPYTARHSAKAAAKRSLSLDHARSMLGQASVETTERYDQGPDLEMAKEVARKIG